MVGGDDEDTHLSREGRYRIVTVRGKQAWAQILRRSSGARLGKRLKFVAIFDVMFCSARGCCDVLDIVVDFWLIGIYASEDFVGK